jgi:hypothetical protein
MADQYTVTDVGVSGRNTPVWRPGVPHEAATLINAGAVTVYLDENPSARTAGQPLSAGSSVLWDADRGLYAATAAGTTSTLVVSPNQGAGFDAGAVAAQLIDQGLAGDIADAISIAGAPPIDAPGMPHDAQQNVATGVAPVTTGIIDIARYNFVEVWVLESGVTTPNTTSRSVTLTWYADAAATIIVHSVVYYYGAYNGNIGIKGPVAGGAMALRLSWTAAATVQTVTLQSWVFGSMRMSSQASSYNGDDNAVIWAGTPADGLGGSGEFIYAQGGVVTPVANTIYPQSYEGPAKLYVQASVVAAGGSFTVLLMDTVHGNAFAAVILGVSAAFQSQIVDVIIPRRPIKITATIAGANATNPAALLVMTPW